MIAISCPEQPTETSAVQSIADLVFSEITVGDETGSVNVFVPPGTTKLNAPENRSYLRVTRITFASQS